MTLIENEENPKKEIINSITENIEIILNKNEWKDIENKKKWMKNCPKCGKIQFYKSKFNLNLSLKNNTWCNRCRYDERSIKKPIDGWKKECPRCRKFLVYPDYQTLQKSIKKNCVCLSCANVLYHRGSRKEKITFDDLKRNCPYCNKEIVYTTKWCRDNAVKNNKWCRECKKKYFKPSKEQIEKQRLKLIGRVVPIDQLKKITEANKNRVHTKEWHDKISKSNRGKKRSDESRKKMRLSKIKYMESCVGQMFPTYNKSACLYFEKMEKEKGWNGYYATKNGEYFIKELGYWVDYYDPIENIVIEWDEYRHYNIDGTLKVCDIKRMLEIKNHLKCRFLRFNEKLSEMKEF